MAKIPFDIKYRPQIEAGEYKVETRSGNTARVVCWDRVGIQLVVLIGKDEDVLTYNLDGTTGQQMQLPSDLFIVTPEEELTEFEKKLWEVLKSEGSPIGPIEKFTDADKDVFHSYAAKLLAIARKELEPEILERLEEAYKNQDEVVYENGKRDGKAEALKDLPRWEKIAFRGTLPDASKILFHDGYYLEVKGLEKLPGFKED